MPPLLHVLALVFFSLPLIINPLHYSQALDTSAQEAGGGTETSKINAKAKLCFGYDNNVSERREDITKSRFFQFYVSSGMHMLPAERTLLSLKLQNGLKYLDASSLSGESVLINGLTLHLSHRISERFMPEIQSEIRGRTSIHSESGVLPSEEAYLRGSVGAALKAVALSDITGRAFYNCKFTNFQDFDPFDRRGHEIGLRADVRLLPDSTVNIQYSRTKTHFYRWDLVSPDEDSRVDTMDGIKISAQIYKYFLFDITYSYQTQPRENPVRARSGRRGEDDWIGARMIHAAWMTTYLY